MIASIFFEGKKIAEVFHKGKVYRKAFLVESFEADFLAKKLAERETSGFSVYNDYQLPPKLIKAFLGATEKESTLILESGIGGFEIKVKSGIERPIFTEESEDVYL